MKKGVPWQGFLKGDVLCENDNQGEITVNSCNLAYGVGCLNRDEVA